MVKTKSSVKGQASPAASPPQQKIQVSRQAAPRSPVQNRHQVRPQVKNPSRFGRFLKYTIGIGIVGAALAYGGYVAYKKGIERVLTDDLNQSRQQLASQTRFYRTAMNNDAIEDMVVFDSSGRGTAYIGMPDGSYKVFGAVQADEKRAFESEQAKARSAFEASQRTYKEKVEGEVARTARKYGVRAQ